jgi:hypothetical protein
VSSDSNASNACRSFCGKPVAIPPSDPPLGEEVASFRIQKKEDKKKHIPHIITSFISSHRYNPVYVRHVDSSSLGFSLSSHRQSYIGLVFRSRFIDLIINTRYTHV